MNAVLTLGLVCIVGAIIGGGFKAFNIETPIIKSTKRQVMLAALGSVLCIFWVFNNTDIPKWLETENEDPEKLLLSALNAYDSGKHHKALKIFKRAASLDLAEAQYHLGEMYWHGEGTKQQNKDGIKWVTKAAEKGFAPAQASLGNSYLYGGHGTSKNMEKGLELLRKASDKGDAYAEYTLGIYFLDKDEAKAVRMIKRAANRGMVEAQTHICVYVLAKNGVIKSEHVTLEYVGFCLRAGAQGSPAAQAVLGKLHSESGDLETAYVWLYWANNSKTEILPRWKQYCVPLLSEIHNVSEKLKPGKQLEIQRVVGPFRPRPEMLYRHSHPNLQLKK